MQIKCHEIFYNTDNKNSAPFRLDEKIKRNEVLILEYENNFTKFYLTITNGNLHK